VRHWQRIDFGEPPTGTPQDVAEEETRRDLLKPLEQLLCDVHEEIHSPGRTAAENAAASTTRMVSLMARVALSNERVSRQMLWLTWIMTVLTIVMLGLTYAMFARG
jgi:hypothetical protein